MTERTKDAFVPKEKAKLPRILLIDFAQAHADKLISAGYTVVMGNSGFTDLPFSIPSHPSEIEIIFWDTSELRKDKHFVTKGSTYDTDSAVGRSAYKTFTSRLSGYFEAVREKDGFIGLILGVSLSPTHTDLSRIIGHDFSFGARTTTTLELEPEDDDDAWFVFFKRYIAEKNIRFSIDWSGNLVGLGQYFSDENDDWYAIEYGNFSIIPHIEEDKKGEALISLLQDVLPHSCGKDIFPDKYFYFWANKDKYFPTKVQVLKAENLRIRQETAERVRVNEDAIANELAASAYLTKMLIADDTDSFSEEDKLSTSVHKVLEKDLGFKVTDIDEIQTALGESRKEDRWIEDDDGFFALAEIKGTDRGAKANWVRQDLGAHIREFEVLRGISGLDSILVFNHERRDEPESRSAPFENDPKLLEFCVKSRIRLIPVYELFKMVNDIRDGFLTPEEARTLIKQGAGLLIYKSRKP